MESNYTLHECCAILNTVDDLQRLKREIDPCGTSDMRERDISNLDAAIEDASWLWSTLNIDIEKII